MPPAPFSSVAAIQGRSVPACLRDPCVTAIAEDYSLGRDFPFGAAEGESQVATGGAAVRPENDLFSALSRLHDDIDLRGGTAGTEQRLVLLPDVVFIAVPEQDEASIPTGVVQTCGQVATGAEDMVMPALDRLAAGQIDVADEVVDLRALDIARGETLEGGNADDQDDAGESEGY